MAINLDTQRTPGLPVVKRTTIGEVLNSMIVRRQQRDVLKDGDKVINPRTGRPKQELVMTVMVLEGTTAPAGIKDSVGVPAPGDLVRVIFRGKSFADFIQEANNLGQLQVGDVLTQVTDSAQAYDANGNSTGKPLTTQEEVDVALRRRQTVGVYGQLSLRRATAAEAAWVAKAEAAYHATSEAIPVDLDEPF